MQQIRNIGEAEKELARYIPLAKELLGKDLTLLRMKPLLNALGNPQDKLKIIHVAGTSGKTSTSYFITSLLNEAGLKTGLTVSPHIDTVAERVQINLNPIGEQWFCNYLTEFLNIVEQLENMPTYFELIVAFAYWVFYKENVDYAVIETGLGGMFDATNVVQRADKICILTDIGIDHTHVLGKTLPDIAGQKAGIIQKNNHVFTHNQKPEILNIFNNVCKEQNAKLNVLSKKEFNRAEHSKIYKHLPTYQKRNWQLALYVFDYVVERDSLLALTNNQIENAMNVVVPGRMDIVSVNNNSVIMDGAHNEQKMEAFVSSYKEKYKNTKADIMLSLKQGKEYKAVLPLIKPICEKLIITTFKSKQDLPAESINPNVLEKFAKSLHFEDVIVEPDYKKATNKLMTSRNEAKIITGSFYLISAVRSHIMK